MHPVSGNQYSTRTNPMTIAIFGNTFHKATCEEVLHVLDILKNRDVRVLLSSELRQEMNLRDQYDPYSYESDEFIDFALSIGGDGTFLTTASFIQDRNIPILGINCGHLGFLADVQTKDVDNVIERLLNNDYTIEQRTVLSVNGYSDENEHPLNAGRLIHAYALNEVAVSKQDLSSMISVETFISTPESQSMEYMHTYKADGLLLSTPTGSTAYNLSIGGPLMVPQSHSFILSPIATHSLTVRPLVIPEEWQIDLKIRSRSHNYLISVDGRSRVLTEDIQLHIEKAPFKINLVQIGTHTFINSLKEKLSWGI